jgi:hypothetical protein
MGNGDSLENEVGEVLCHVDGICVRFQVLFVSRIGLQCRLRVGGQGEPGGCKPLVHATGECSQLGS